MSEKKIVRFQGNDNSQFTWPLSILPNPRTQCIVLVEGAYYLAMVTQQSVLSRDGLITPKQAQPLDEGAEKVAGYLYFEGVNCPVNARPSRIQAFEGGAWVIFQGLRNSPPIALYCEDGRLQAGTRRVVYALTPAEPPTSTKTVVPPPPKVAQPRRPAQQGHQPRG